MAITGFDPAANFAIANLDAGIASGVTSIVLVAGKGALFPSPAADGAFNVVIYNSTDYGSPWQDPSAEIVRVTAKSTDTLTVTRAQEGTADVNHNTGGKTYSLYMTFTKKAYDDLVAALIAVRGVTLGGTGRASHTAYAVICGGTTSTAAQQSVASVGTVGQVLTSGGAGALPSFQDPSGGGDPTIVGFKDGNNAYYTDDLNYIPVVDTALFICSMAVNTLAARYVGGNRQTIAPGSLLGSSGFQGAICTGGFIYAFVGVGGGSFALYRIATSGDASSAGNWTAITLSGANITTNSHLLGYENGNFWLCNNAQTSFVRATLSGTTLTEQAVVGVSGSTFLTTARVNDQGLWTPFAANPVMRLADTAGSLVTNNTVHARQRSFVTADNIYLQYESADQTASMKTF